MNEIEKARLIREASLLLDRIERNMAHIVDSIKAKKRKVA
jgi:hypothetical protein